VRERIWIVVPAAGASRRLARHVPKQHLEIAGRTMLEHALAPLLGHPSVAGGVIVLALGDGAFGRLPEAMRKRLTVATGGRERCHSVRAGLAALVDAAADDWVLVHDAARPCLPPEDLERLVEACADDPVGGLLAVPVADTLKRAATGLRVGSTAPRDGLWRAMTPQMFRFGILAKALDEAIASGHAPDDEATAIERLGLQPRLVEGSPTNIKVTHPADLDFAALVLQARAGDTP